jgi:pyridoxamine 5'-phosphate oxidase family protein
MTFTPTALDYLASQPLGRLATVAPGGSPQNNPLSFRYNAGLGTIDIGGHNTSASRKIRNIRAGGTVAFVVDDILSFKPWRVRCVEIGGTAEALNGTGPADVRLLR